MNFLKFHLGPPCPTVLRPAGGPPLKQHFGHFRGGPPTGQAACGRPLPLWTPHIVHLWMKTNLYLVSVLDGVKEIPKDSSIFLAKSREEREVQIARHGLQLRCQVFSVGVWGHFFEKVVQEVFSFVSFLHSGWTTCLTIKKKKYVYNWKNLKIYWMIRW
jgi:hypothetical protein